MSDSSTRRAEASVVIYSIVKTAKANSISVRNYLEYLFTVMPTENWRKDLDMLDSLTPCSPEIRRKLKLIISLQVSEYGGVIAPANR